jgi:3-keto-disaccharide hydrolase
MRHTLANRFGIGTVLLLAAGAAAIALQAPAQQPGGAAQGRGRGGFARPEPLPFEYHEGYDSIFDGTSLKGWDGDPKLWRAEGNAIVGETTPENKIDENTFLIWRGGEPADFELKLEYRISATNSGIQFRSVQLPQGSPDGRGGSIKGKWVLKGYQADIDYANMFTGQIYEERGRGFLAMRGQMTVVPEGGGPKILGALQTGADDLKGIIKANDWNQVHLIARGDAIIQVLNGHVTSMLVDHDTKNRAMSGLLGIQMHVGEPMKIEVRNVWMKKL